MNIKKTKILKMEENRENIIIKEIRAVEETTYLRKQISLMGRTKKVDIWVTNA